MGEGRGALALTLAAWPSLLAAETADRVGEVVMAAATIAAVVLMAFTLPALLRRDRVGRARVTPALVILTAAAAITFVAYLGFIFRCDESGCGVPSGQDVLGVEPWWRDDTAWQWGGQLALAGIALVLSSAALTLAVRERAAARRAVLLARVAVGAWVLLAFLVPLGWELLAD